MADDLSVVKSEPLPDLQVVRSEPTEHPGFLAGLAESMPLQMHQFPTGHDWYKGAEWLGPNTAAPNENIPSLGEKLGGIVPNFVLGGGELLRKLFSGSETPQALGNIAGSLTVGGPEIPGPLGIPQSVARGVAKGAWKGAFDPVTLSKLGFEFPIPQSAIGAIGGGYLAHRLGLPEELGLAGGAAYPVIRGAFRGGREAFKEALTPPPGIEGVGAAPPPAGPESMIPPDLLDQVTEGATGKKGAKFSNITDPAMRENVLRRAQSVMGSEMNSTLNRSVHLTPESASPAPSANPFPEHPDVLLHGRIGVAMRDAKDLAIAQRLKSLNLNPENMSIEELTPHYKALNFDAPGQSGGRYARPAELGREHLIRMFKSLGGTTP